MKVYVAAPFGRLAEATEVMHDLESSGVTVTSSWLRGHTAMDDAHARLDLDDVARADVLLALNPEAWKHEGGGGRWVEFGYALALGKQIVLVGVRTNVFHHLDCVRVIERVEDL